MSDWRQRVSRGAYGALLTALTPAYLFRLWWRGRAEPLYRHAMLERLGGYAGPRSAGWVWVHAVSLGETRAAAALIHALRERRPGMRLLLTHSTATGLEAGRSLLREGDLQTWLPYDAPGAVNRFFAQFRPKLGVLMETEVWPNLLLAAKANAVPMVLANARLSEKSSARGKRLDAVLRPAAESLALVLAQSEDDARRLRAAGARDVVVTGNLKFDMTPDTVQLELGRAWRAWLGRDVVLAAITRQGEEAMLLGEWVRLSTPRPLLLIVPRHPQRFDEVAALIGLAGLTFSRRSTWSDMPPPSAALVDVWLGDSMQEMALYYGMGQVALLGGSYEPFGGQNLIEAAACACPVVMGPHTFNFSGAASLSLAAGAAVRVADMSAGVRESIQLLEPVALRQQSERALAFASQHRGAAQRMAMRLDALMAS